MKKFNDIETIWKQQKEQVVPEVTTIINKANKEKKTILKKIIVQVILLLFTVPVVIWVLMTNPFQETTTFLGIAVILFDIIGFSIMRLYQVNLLTKIDFTQTPNMVLHELEKYYNLQKIISSKVMVAYFLLMNLGLGLYFIEVMSPMSPFAIGLSLSVYILWMLFAYFVIGKKQRKKEFDRIDALIEKVKEIEEGYDL